MNVRVLVEVKFIYYIIPKLINKITYETNLVIKIKMKKYLEVIEICVTLHRKKNKQL
nr:MAG TPA: hypothetical protein [Bacteriophage sp.]